MMMCCNTFQNINGGQRYDLGTFVEWERKWDPQWTTLLGVRNDAIWMNTGTVQGYSSMYQGDANVFNAEDRARTFMDFDATALARSTANPSTTYEGGYSMKTRAPSLYELYDWSSQPMAAMMNGWAGDGNMYAGNINLKPETAHTLQRDLRLARRRFLQRQRRQRRMAAEDHAVLFVCRRLHRRRAVQPFQHGTKNRCTAKNASLTSGTVELQYVNQNAEIFGADLYGRMPLFNSGQYGKFALEGVAGYDRGINLVTGGGLYHMMPLNAKIDLQHKLGNWSNVAELKLVDNKSDVETVRNELQTPGYALVNLRSSYQWGQVRFDAGIENLLNQQYYSPLGGAYLGNEAAGHPGLADTGAFTPLAGMGRTVYAGITVKF